MTNAEKYKDEILRTDGDFCDGFTIPMILKPKGLRCIDMGCHKCGMIQALWFNEEYKEPEVDWTKVAVDTKILVSNDGEHWEKRYFAKYEKGIVYSFRFGKTSWSTEHNYGLSKWEFAKLAEVEE